MVSVTLQHEDINSGTPVNLLCNAVAVSGRKLNQAKPNANNTGPVPAQTQGYENLKYVVRNIHLTGAANTLTYADIITLYKSAYGGTNPATLTITTDSGVLQDMNGNTSGISVVLDGSIDIPFDVTRSRDAYIPICTLTFVETD